MSWRKTDPCRTARERRRRVRRQKARERAAYLRLQPADERHDTWTPRDSSRLLRRELKRMGVRGSGLAAL